MENHNSQRSIHLVDTETTVLQSETENECSPFFADVSTLPQSQIDHLRQVGLLPSSDDSTPNHDDDSSNSRRYEILLLRKRHIAYLKRPLYPKHIRPLPGSYISLDASKPWILYWTLHGLDLLDALSGGTGGYPDVTEETLLGIVHTLLSCWSDVDLTPFLKGEGDDDDIHSNSRTGGGFGGGPNQIPHCATTYAAVLALTIIAGSDAHLYPHACTLALQALRSKRHPITRWFRTLRHDQMHGCGYRMHHDGEVDVRASYIVCSISSLLGTIDSSLTRNVLDYLCSCQTYEGGFGGEPGTEAHGGYSYCALAAIRIITSGEMKECGVDWEALKGWLARRQMAFEGGYSGRGNKLVDGCYSFWQGAAVAILNVAEDCDGAEKNKDAFWDSGVYGVLGECDGTVIRPFPSTTTTVQSSSCREGKLSLDQEMLQRYILLCAQDVNGGLRDKPSKPRDFYHTCYNLSGLSVVQHVLSDVILEDNGGDKSSAAVVYGNRMVNEIGRTHPVFNIRVEHVLFAKNKFCVGEDGGDGDGGLDGSG